MERFDPLTKGSLSSFLELTYERFNRPEYISPDPLEAVRDYPDIRDREIAALIASSLAVGRAGLIVSAARDAMVRMGGKPRDFLESSGVGDVDTAFTGFRYRFFSGADIAALLCGAKYIIDTWGSLGSAFSDFARERKCDAVRDARHAGTVVPALARFASELRRGAAVSRGFSPDASSPPRAFAPNLFPSPESLSACKRPFLMLRWLVRRDAVDPGGWDRSLAPSLVQPMDTHMGWAARKLGLIAGGEENGRDRKNPPAANLSTALEVTAKFAELCPEDPIRYDFSLTRPGIRPDLDRGEWFSLR